MWFVFWSLFAFSTPADHPRISAEEKKYIESTIYEKSASEDEVAELLCMIECVCAYVCTTYNYPSATIIWFIAMV